MKKLFITIFAALTAICSFAENAPRYIFYFIGDGMGLGHVNAALAYNRDILGNNEPLLMMQFPINSVCTTFSASSPVTDSAAAGTALATGHKTRNSMIGVTPDSAAVQSIAQILHNRNWGVAIATSVAPDDATPAAFYAHQPSRYMFYQIGLDAAASGYEFIAGSNLRGIKDKDGNPTDLMRQFEQNNVAVVRGIDQLNNTDSQRVVLLNTDSISVNNIGYTIDSIPQVLTLPQITQAAVNHLQKHSPDRFFIMVEGGNIDHAAHANDGGAVIKEILNFNQAIAIAYNFYLSHPDETLIVITADHDTGGLALGNSYLKYTANLGIFDRQKISKDNFSAICKAILNSRRIYTWEDMKQLLADKFGFWTDVNLTDEQTETLHNAFIDTFELHRGADEKTLYNSFNSFAVTVFKTLNDHAGIGFTTTSHAGNLVPVYAIGAGSHVFNSLNDNTQIPLKILSLVNHQ